jgi:peptidoglycan/LPS O-acetylase OafA/YrhL
VAARIPALDGLRGIAVLFVVLSHMSLSGLRPHPILHFGGSGKYGVYLFFVLSSFLLSLHYFRTPARPPNKPGYWAAYTVRRIFRIYPLYTIVLLAGWAVPFLGMALYGPHDATVLRHLLLLDGHKIFWAIPVEVKFYLLLPFLLVLYDAVLKRRAGPALAIVAVATMAKEYWLPVQFYHGDPLALGVYLPAFLLGHGAAVLHAAIALHPLSDASRRILDVAGIAAFVAVLATIPTWYAALTGTDTVLVRFHNAVAEYGIAWSIVLLAATNGDGIVRRVFEWRPLRFVGVVSFSIYLGHLPVIEYMRRALADNGPLLTIPATLAAIVALAWLTYTLIEKPAMRLGATISRRLE